ncbi:MAG: hypothetical protein AB1847_11135 [bacterium]
MERDVEKLAEMLDSISLPRKRGDMPRRTPDCLTEERLEAYYQGTLPKPEGMEIGNHLSNCQYCFDRLIILDELMAGEHVEVPRRLMAGARQTIFGSSNRVLEIVLSITQKAIRIIKNTGELLTPEPVLQPARGQEDKVGHGQLSDFLIISKEFQDLKMDVQIECVNDSYKVILNASDPHNGTPLSGARLALFSGGRELSSIEDSEAIFYLKLRKYLIKVLFEEREMGEIRLDLRKAS